MATQLRTVTAEDLLKMPDDGFRYELVGGELRRMSPAGNKHGRIAALLTGFLIQHVMANKLGAVYAAETGFKLSENPDTVRAPDVAFVRQERLEEVGEVEGFWPGAPDLVIEVLSPGDAYSEVEGKTMTWLEAGARMVAVVDPHKRTVTVYRSLSDIAILDEGATLHGGEVVPGWLLPLREIFV